VSREEHEAVKKQLTETKSELEKAKAEIEALRNSDTLAYAKVSKEENAETRRDSLKRFIESYPGSSLRPKAEEALQRVEKEIEQERRRQQEAEQAEARRNALVARFSCNMFGTPLPLLNCLDGTEIKVRSGGRVTLISQLSLASQGLVGTSVELPLQRPFQVLAQNGLENATLTLHIVDGSGRVVFTDQASYARVINVKD
jgi:hypothetical protein